MSKPSRKTKNPRRTHVRIDAELFTRPGAYVLEYQHDDGCPARRSQYADDCRCDPNIITRRAEDLPLRRARGGR